MFREYNLNPKGKRVGDCVIRAISTVTGVEWEDVYMDLADKGLEMGDMPSSNAVWGSYLQDIGFKGYIIPEDMTVKEFARKHNKGVYILATGNHVVAVIDGDYCDTWDSGDEIPIYYFKEV